MSGPSRRAALLIALGGVLQALSYPPFRLPVLSFVAVTPAVVLLRERELEPDLRGTLRLGFWYGFVSQGLVLYWLVQNILTIVQQMIMNRYWKDHPAELQTA